MINVNEARSMVCEAGKKLLKEGLVARTWGNVSIRIDEERMVITPSGRPYNQLTPEDMVVVNIYDLSYEGSVKPSSELKLHCALYKNRPEVTSVMHTHQMYASIVAAAQKDVIIEDENYASILGTSVVKAAPYALPNTKKITKATARAVGKSNAALMSNHGAVCCGNSLDDVFEKCKVLELACKDFIERHKI